MPDVTGQPAWVVVILAVLALLGTMGVAWLTTRRKSATQEQEEQATLAPGVKGGPDNTVQFVQSALDHLARVAEREAAESDKAREEAADLRRELQQTLGQLTEARQRAESAEAHLAACRAHADLLSKQAFRRGDDE